MLDEVVFAKPCSRSGDISPTPDLAASKPEMHLEHLSMSIQSFKRVGLVISVFPDCNSD
jgi:hypothetical protein